MENFRNYYDILGVSREATFSDIKQAYRKLARQYHPDLNPGDQAAEDQFKLLSEAYTVLSDDEKRAQYEKFSEYWQQEGFKKGQGKSVVSDLFSGRISLEDFGFGEFPDFNVFVDQLLNRRPPRRSASDDDGYPANTATYSPSTSAGRRDAEADLTVPLEKAFRGGRERIRLEDGRSLEVNMPAGMVTGQRIRLRGQGVGGGNLYLRIQVDPHPFYTLRGNDVYCRLPITPSEAALGSAIDIPTLDGPVRTSLPQGAQTGQVLQLPGRGYPVGKEGRGDQIVELEVVVPTGLSDREKALYEELRQTERFRPRADLFT
ncbi:DnaJ C-terminal domain-containing protein [Phormidium tenue]|uniref:Molecular chaperone DnaJ n=1 Tax=Phormidium tenue NIES-30 TaxID=549789 RepID=A0A1U7J5B1_9CYAN|nr:J domain-containing protein [Phormidium tenue]MBD2232659.1 J domain-containing protein [Phormidium tenue FACHB-1052]OKH47787.1 molecular chaperone DnaJ [Phormidium tenue NIES-30]